MVDHGVDIEHVVNMNKKDVEEQFKNISEKIHSDSTYGKIKSRLMTLAEKVKKAWEDEKEVLLERLMTARGEGEKVKNMNSKKILDLYESMLGKYNEEKESKSKPT